MKYVVYARKSTEEDDRQLLSIDAQLRVLREYVEKESLCVVREFVESKTVKIPGRPVFNSMMEKIEQGHAQGIIAWHPDRLARNSVDGGRAIYLLDIGALLDLRFPNFLFENNPHGKFVLTLAFGQSKYFVDQLAANIRRAQKEKLLRGEFPSKPPIGYLNEPRLRTIVVDETNAPLVLRMFEACAKDSTSLPKLRNLVASWGLLSPKGNPLALSKMSVLLSNPFYIGLFRYNCELHEGSHDSIIPRDLFDRVQAVLKRRTKVVSKKQKQIAYLGLLRCGDCGCSITGERQKGHHYHKCTKKKEPCSQHLFIREEVLTNQLRKASICLGRGC